MKLKPISINIDEEPGSGHIRVNVTVIHHNGASSATYTIREHTIGQKLETVTESILETLKDYQKDGSLEESLEEYMKHYNEKNGTRHVSVS